MALLRLASDPAGSQTRGWIRPARAGNGDRTQGLEAARAVLPIRDRQRSSGSQSDRRDASGPGPSADLPAVRPPAIDPADLRAAVERVVIIQGEGDQSSAVRPMRTKARAILTDALRDAQRWLDELTTTSDQTIAALAARERKTERSIRMTLSLAFLSPTLVKAAIDGRLPRGFGVKRLMDLPMAWSDQWSALGLKTPAQA